jgi:hypothetical protein
MFFSSSIFRFLYHYIYKNWLFKTKINQILELLEEIENFPIWT